ncbi:MAG: acetate--CoA ligase family protein, partial [Alphaproteobacteria bacterium]
MAEGASARVDLAQALLRPRAVALIGASGDAKKNTSRPQRYLAKHGFAGTVYPVNPTRKEIFGALVWPDIASLPCPVDHAYIMLPAEAAIDAVAECGKAGIPVATLLADGFAEAGADGAALQARLVETARAGGVRLLGPNSIGVVNPPMGLALTANAALEADSLPKGRFGVVSHSGSLLGMLLSRGAAHGLGFAGMISLGNEADIGLAEAIAVLTEDRDTDAILLYLETVRAPEATAAALRGAYEAGKPVVAFKLGRSQAGQALTVSHTGAIAGSDAMTGAFLRDNGALRVDLAETLIEAPMLAIGRRPMARGRIAVMSTTGGGGAMVVDRLGLMGVEVVAPPRALIDGLAAQGITIGDGLLTDLTLAGTRREVYSAVLNALLASDHCDAVVAVVGTSAQFQPQHAVQPILDAAPAAKPLAVFLTPQADDSLHLLAKAGIAAFRTPEGCADAVRALVDWRAPRVLPKAAPPGLADANRLLAASRGPMSEAEAGAVFAALGVAAPANQVIAAPDDAGALTSAIGYPVAAKLLSPDIAHKTEASAVALGVGSDAELAAAWTAMRTRVGAVHPNARIDGLLLQSMESGLAEVLVGYRDDPQAGPAVVLGMGGTLAEIYADTAIRLAPVTTAEAREMIAEVRGLALLRGYRNLPDGDLAALAETVAAVSWLAAAEPAVAEAEINPLIVKAAGEGVVAVD